MVNKLEAAINEISEELFVLDKAYIKYKSQNYITFTYGSVLLPAAPEPEKRR